MKKCFICGNKNKPFFEFPNEIHIRTEWIKAIENLCDTSRITDYTVLCKEHFEPKFIRKVKNRLCLIKGSVPTVFPISASEISNSTPQEYFIPQTQNIPKTESKCTQVNLISPEEVADLRYHHKVLTLRLKRLNAKYSKCLSQLKELKEEKSENQKKLNIINKISEGVANCDEKAIILMDLLENYCRKVPRWSEMSVRLCTIWRFCSSKGYEYCRNHLFKLPSKTTISRFLGEFTGPNQLCKDRLCAEISKLSVPIERVCSLIVDDMSIKQKMSYSRSEDHIYGLDNTKSMVVGERPAIANKMLCFVIHGLSTKYVIPAGYFFHATMSTDTFYSLTMNMLQLLTDCGFIVLRLVADNHSSNVALFKKLSCGVPKNYIPHPILGHLPLFLSFDFCHAIKNARSIFLDHDMRSSEGTISSSYLKKLYDLQKGLPVKPVRFLTKRHLFPNNFDKMNVLRAIQIFSPTITVALRFLKAAGDRRFQNVDPTISFMENMNYFFQIHNVSNRTQYIRSLDSSVAPYVDVSDERLHWLHVTFQNFIDDIQTCSADAKMRGLSEETAHALKFTAKSTYLCIKFLLQQGGFYYVLTRSFSSDAIEATFSHVRLRGGSNDATDARTAEYAMRQILRCGIVKASKSSNIAEHIDFVSHATTQNSSCLTESEELMLPLELRIEIQNLRIESIPNETIFSASVAFLAGYIIKKLDEKFHCDDCLTTLLSFELPGSLLQLIALQDRGGLTYPNSSFVGLIQQISNTVMKVLPFLNQDKACKQLTNLIIPHLKQNPLFTCSNHKDVVCEFVIKTTVKPVLDNICLETTDLVKRTLSLHHKPISRKVLKL